MLINDSTWVRTVCGLSCFNWDEDEFGADLQFELLVQRWHGVVILLALGHLGKGYAWVQNLGESGILDSWQNLSGMFSQKVCWAAEYRRFLRDMRVELAQTSFSDDRTEIDYTPAGVPLGLDPWQFWIDKLSSTMPRLLTEHWEALRPSVGSSRGLGPFRLELSGRREIGCSVPRRLSHAP
jgi:hypothetical protein